MARGLKGYWMVLQAASVRLVTRERAHAERFARSILGVVYRAEPNQEKRKKGAKK